MSERAMIALRGVYAGQTCWIVGSGPSLRFLRREHFWEGPVLAINQSIVTVQALELLNPLYSMQKNGYEGKMVRPRDEVTLVLQDTGGYSGEWFPEHPKRLLIRPNELGLKVMEMSARMCARLARVMGCRKIVFVCCDSMRGICGSYQPTDGSISHGNDAHYMALIRRMEGDLRDWDYEVILPEEAA